MPVVHAVADTRNAASTLVPLNVPAPVPADASDRPDPRSGSSVVRGMKAEARNASSQMRQEE